MSFYIGINSALFQCIDLFIEPSTLHLVDYLFTYLYIERYLCSEVFKLLSYLFTPCLIATYPFYFPTFPTSAQEDQR